MRAVVVGAQQPYLRGQATGTAFAARHRLSFDTYQGALSGDGGVTNDALLVSMGRPAGGCAFGLQSFGNRARLNLTFPSEGGIGYESIDMTAFPPPGRWSHVEILLEKKSDLVVATIVVDGVLALDQRNTQCRVLTTDPSVVVGLLATPNIVPLNGEARYDNVLLTAD